MPPSIQHSPIPDAVMATLERLRAAGDRPLLVGGWVRDALLGCESSDYDVASRLGPVELEVVLPGVDPRFGSVDASNEGCDITVTCMRLDGEYTDQRHPSSVEFVSTPEQDAPRRDFSINALYCDPWTREVIDPCGGVVDLRERRLSLIGDPAARLFEDPLRLLRAVRFAARCDLAIESNTADALRSTASELQSLSAERVFEELTRAFTGPGRGTALRLLLETGMAAQVLPEVVAMPGVEQPPEYHPEGDVFVHVCLVLDHVVAGDPVQAWAAVLHDVGKPATFERAEDRIRFSGHDTLSAEMADAALRRFNAPRELRETVVEICRDHIRFAAIERMKPAKRERWLRSPRFASHLAFHRADCMASHEKLGIYEWAAHALRNLAPLPPPPLCTGVDVLALGVCEGPVVGELLRQLAVIAEEKAVSDRDGALGILRRLVDRRFSGSG